MSLDLLFHYLLLNMFRMLIHPSSGACDLFDELFHGLYCSGSMCFGVTLWFGWVGVVSGCRLQPASGYHTSQVVVFHGIALPKFYLHFYGTVRDRIPVRTRFFARPDRPWGPPSLL